MTQRSLPELEALIGELELAITTIKNDIDEAKATQKATGKYADPLWFASATKALRIKGMQHQELLRQAGALRKSAKQEKQDSLESRFVGIARRQLDPDLFDWIMDRAQEEARA